jgi:hypothetical protein
VDEKENSQEKVEEKIWNGELIPLKNIYCIVFLFWVYIKPIIFDIC